MATADILWVPEENPGEGTVSVLRQLYSENLKFYSENKVNAVFALMPVVGALVGVVLLFLYPSF